MDVKPDGGSDKPEPDAKAECVLFVVEGELNLTLSGKVTCDAARWLCLYSAGGEMERAEQEREAGASFTGSARLTTLWKGSVFRKPSW